MDDFTHERWLAVAGYEGSYEVSDLGRVRGLPRLGGDGRRLSGRILKPRPTPKGYLRVNLCLDGVAVDKYIHILVAEAFIGPCPEGQEVRHWDGDPANCAVTNLLYGTHSENMYDVVRHGHNHNATKTHCDNGHEFTPENTIPNGAPNRRACRICTLAYQREWYAKYGRKKPTPVSR